MILKFESSPWNLGDDFFRIFHIGIDVKFSKKLKFIVVVFHVKLMHFTCLIHYSMMILRDNSHHCYACYHVLIKFLHSWYHIIYKLTLH